MGRHSELAGLDLHAPSYQKVVNESGLTLPALTVVRPTSSVTQFIGIDVSVTNSDPILGITTSELAPTEEGMVFAVGVYQSVDSSAWVVGTVLYADQTTGVLTDAPAGPKIAIVVKSDAVNGILYIYNNIDPGLATGLSINVLPEMTDPVNEDIMVIEDASNGFAQRKVTYSNLFSSINLSSDAITYETDSGPVTNILDDLKTPMHGVFGHEGSILSTNANPLLYDIAAFDYYINGVKYSYAGATGVNPNWQAGDDFQIVGVDAGGLYLYPKNNFPTPTSLINTLEIGGLATTDGTNIAYVGDSHFSADFHIRTMHQIQKFVIGTTYLGTAAAIVESTTPGQFDITGGTLFDSNSNMETITSANNIGMVGNYHVGGSYDFIPLQTPFVVNDNVYDNGTGLVAIANQKYATHFIMRSSRTSTVYFSYGLNQYDSLGEAVDAPIHLGQFEGLFGSDIQALAKVIVKQGLGIQTIVDVRNQTSTIVSASTSTLQTTYDRSITPEITTDVTRGALTIRGGTGTDTANNLEIKNNAGTTTASIQANGAAKVTGISKAIVNVSTDTTLTNANHTIIVDAVAADVVITLPAAASYPGGVFVIKKVDVSTNTLTISGPQTIDNMTQAQINKQNTSLTIQSDGTEWWII